MAKTPAAAGRTKADDSGDARARLLDAAEQLFARDGFDATATARIAEQAGVPKGLLFYYFPTKIALLRTLLGERLPSAPLCEFATVARRGDVAGSLLRLNRRVGLREHSSPVLRTIIHREAETHPEVGEYIRELRQGLLELTESVLDASAAQPLDPTRRRQAAQTFVAVMLDDANSRRFDAPEPDVRGMVGIIADGLCCPALLDARGAHSC